MPFESLSDRLQSTLKKIKGQSRLTSENMDEMLREIRLSLLEADVNYNVVKGFIDSIRVKAEGQEVIGSLNPGQMVVKIVHNELVDLLGTEVSELELSKNPTIIMMVGLQGAGKTTSAGKIATYLTKKHAKKPLLVAADIYRPAAINQLITIGQQLNIPVFEKGNTVSPVSIAQEAIEYASHNNHDVILIDTAGRLHIDEVLMTELLEIKNVVNPSEILLVVDALTGQDIINVASTFNEKLSITGAVLTKLDGDSRGGGALSVRKVTGVPIKFVGTGEKLDSIDLFYPDRMADRILGMGDVLSLIEKAQDVIDEKEAAKSIAKLQQGTFDLDDMLKQLRQVKKLGSMTGLFKMIPGMPKLPDNINDEETDKRMKKTEAIILSMTKEEKREPSIIKESRKKRIANGSGTNVADINALLKQFEQSKQLMTQMSRMNPATGMPSQKPKPVQSNGKKERHKKKKR